MRRRTPLTALAACWLATGVVLAQTPRADTVFANGRFYLPGGSWASFMAVGRGVILAVGDEAAVADYKGPKTQTIDLHGATVLPGFHDMHIHPISGGRQYLECPIPRGSTPGQIKAVVQECAAKRKSGEWITGRGWTNSVFQAMVQDHTLLDQAAPHNPVILADETGHSSWANLNAMKIGGIDRRTPNPLNGIIEHNARGEPTGVLRESAGALIRNHIAPLTEEQKDIALTKASAEMLSYGITSVQDAGGYDNSTYDSIAVYARLSDRGVKMPRVRVCMRWTYNITGDDPIFDAIYARHSEYTRDRVWTDCVKLGLDGVPGDGHTAAMLAPYQGVKDSDSEQYRHGILTTPPAVLDKMVTQFDRDGLSVLMHCTGDACARAALDAIESARKANGWSGKLHQVGHNNFTTPEDLERGRQLGTSFEFSAYLYYRNPATETYLRAIGPERFERYKPLRESIDDGANTIEGSDWPVSSSVSPWIAIETLVTRQRPGGGGEPPLAPKEEITLQEAFDVYTKNAARQFGHSDQVGELAPGMLADFIVLDRNPFRIPITDVHATQVQATFIEGEEMYRRPLPVSE